MNTITRILLTVATTLIAPCSAAEQSPGFWERSVAAVNETTTFPLGDERARAAGWFSGAWDGTKRIANTGAWDLYLSGYTWHLPYAYTPEERAEENALTYGLGIGKTLTDQRDNQRSLYALIIEDSNYETQYSAGYAWMARWRIMSDVRVGLGYTAFIMARADTRDYLPFPGVAPLASIGSDKLTFFATYIPLRANILYFFGRISFDAK